MVHLMADMMAEQLEDLLGEQLVYLMWYLMDL